MLRVGIMDDSEILGAVDGVYQNLDHRLSQALAGHPPNVRDYFQLLDGVHRSLGPRGFASEHLPVYAAAILL